MKTIRVSILLMLGVLASACNPPAEAGPELTVVISPAAQPVSAAVAACMPNTENLSVSLDVRYSDFVALDEVDFFIQLGEPAVMPEFSAQISWEKVVVILHADNELDLSRAQLADLFSGRARDWAELGGEAGAVSLWVGPESDEARQAFEAGVLGESPVTGAAKLATNPEDVLAGVAADPAAAGLLAAAWADGAMRVIESGVELPVLALAAEEPSGAARELLACLQGEVGQAALAELYAPLEP
jgi:hypothetical protein